MSALILITLIVLLQAADIVTTVAGLRAGAVEANPVARLLFGRLGVLPAAIAAKLLSTAPMVVLAYFYPRWWPVPALFAASLVWVVRNNRRALKLQRSDGG